MRYLYGASFNCRVGNGNAIGGGGEGDITLDYLSNDLKKLEETLEGSGTAGRNYVICNTHEYVGMHCELGAEVVSVLGDVEPDGEYFHVIAVIFETPHCPTIVE